MKDDQAENLDRVRAKIADAVLLFLRGVKSNNVGGLFSLKELEAAVGQCTPGSPGRILRDLRRRGKIDYEIVSRAESRYRLLAMGETLAMVFGASGPAR